MAELEGNVSFCNNLHTPPIYNGSEDPSNWVKYFRSWSEINKIKAEKAYLYIPFYLKGSAKVWFEGLKDEIQNNSEELVKVSKEIFALDNELELELKQNENESALEYLDRYRIMAKEHSIPEKIEILYTKKGFLRKLQYSVHFRDPKTL